MNAKSGLKNQIKFMPITLFNNNKAVAVDNCSSCSYVLKSTADSLQCKPSRKVELSFRGAFSEDTVSSNLVQLHIGISTLLLLRLPYNHSTRWKPSTSI